MHPFSTIAIIVAAGKGLRMNHPVPKQYMMLHHQPVLVHTLTPFYMSYCINQIILVGPQNDESYCHRHIISPLQSSLTHQREKPIHYVTGGETRQESVYNGLTYISQLKQIDLDHTLVAIHDGVRPFISQKQIDYCISAATHKESAILAIQAYDTVKQVDQAKGMIVQTMNREIIWLAQTPQVFKYQIIWKAHTHAITNQINATDDAMLVELTNQPVHIIPGSRLNIKLTSQEDFRFAKCIIQDTLGCNPI